MAKLMAPDVATPEARGSPLRSLPTSPAASASCRFQRSHVPREGPLQGGGAVHVSCPALHRALFPDGGSIDDTEASHVRRAASNSGADAPRGGELQSQRREKAASSTTQRAAIDAQREKDQRQIRGRIEQGKAMRDARFSRVLAEVTNSNAFARQTARQLHGMDKQAQRRCEDLHQRWQEAVEEPIAQQLDRHEAQSPEARRARQTFCGRKQVAVKAPDDEFRIRLDISKDPLRHSLVDHAWEEAFDAESKAILSGSTTRLHPSELRATIGTWIPTVPKSRSRRILEPTAWGQTALQATPYGRFTQVVELGAGARMGKRAACGAGGQHDAFIPSEADGVPVAGRRPLPETGSHFGILDGDWGVRGEAAQFKTELGGSSGAPVQDHYQYERGNTLMLAEFPLGKRHFPTFPG